MRYFAVIDTETNWANQVMSIGCCIANADNFQLLDAKYMILTPEFEVGGMYESTLFDGKLKPDICSRKQALTKLKDWFSHYGVTDMYAYNACFDRNHLPELSYLHWYDIMRLAAYKQYNPCIPQTADCCRTGRLKRDYGVEPMLQLLSGNKSYYETHNAIYDAMDELQIMKLLGYAPDTYPSI